MPPSSLNRRCSPRLWPVFVPGRRFSGLAAIQPGHELVTTGIYGIVRRHRARTWRLIPGLY